MADMNSLAKSVNMNNLIYLPLELNNKDDFAYLIGNQTKTKLYKEIRRTHQHAKKNRINTNLHILL